MSTFLWTESPVMCRQSMGLASLSRFPAPFLLRQVEHPPGHTGHQVLFGITDFA